MPEHIPSGGSGELDPTGEIKVDTLGRYKILSELGRGGCGVVYRALDPSIGRVVAIKTILAAQSMGREARERFRREARSAGNLYHPNIVTVHDFSDSGSSMYIAMEFVDGRTLADIMSSGFVPMELALATLRSAADALDYAHSHQIVHRDIKPANFMIGTNGRLKITDFGIAKTLDKDEGLTSTGMLVGTAQYMSPEQISEKPVTGRSDQFSLAVIAYELLTGVKPFQGNSWASIIHAIIMAEPAPVNRYRGNLGEAVNQVLGKALSKNPEDRYATCLEFCGALEQAIRAAPEEKTAILPNPERTAPAPALGDTKTSVSLPTSRTGTIEAPVSSPEPAQARKPSSFKPLLIGAAGGVLIAAALWIGLRQKPAAPVSTARQASPVQPQSSVVQPPAPATDTSNPKIEAPGPAPRTPGAPNKTMTKSTTAPSNKEAAKAKQETPVVVATTPIETAKPAPPPQVSQPPQPPAVSNPAPAAPPQVETPRPSPDDAAKRLADKRAADEQGKRLADEQAKRDEQTRLAAEQARRAADEQAKNARAAAELGAITRALASYRSAYDRKDTAALQSIWPAIPKQLLDEIRRSFRDASEVHMELQPVGDPKISGDTATVVCDRNLRQVIMKQTLQASSKVRIVLVRTGTGWSIQSVEAVN